MKELVNGEFQMRNAERERSIQNPEVRGKKQKGLGLAEPPGSCCRRSTVDGRLDSYPGDDRLSHAVPRAVPWALEGLTTVFGMGTGVAPPV